MRKFRAIISMLLAFVLVVSVFAIAIVSTGVVSAASAAPSLSLSNKYNGIRGEWEAVSGASHYIVYYRRASESRWSSDITNNNYYPLLDTEPGTLYCMQVQSVAADGTAGSYSRVKSLTFIPRVVGEQLGFFLRQAGADGQQQNRRRGGELGAGCRRGTLHALL